MFTSKYSRIVLFLIVTCGLLVGGILIMKSPASASRPKTWSRSYEGWKYQGLIGPGGIVDAKISLSSEGVGGLKRYAQANRSLAQQLWQSGQNSLEVQVILRRPISVEALARLQSQSGMTVKDVEASVLSGNSPPISMGWIVNDPSNLRSPFLDRTLTDVAQKTKAQPTFRGVISFAATVERSGYDKLAAAPDVFLVDATFNQIKQDALNVASGERLYLTPNSGIVGRPGFGSLEALGLENFQ